MALEFANCRVHRHRLFDNFICGRLAFDTPCKRSSKRNACKYRLSYENVSFTSERDGIPLIGWSIPAATSNGLTVIVAHGYKNNRLQDNVPVMSLIEKLSSKGYNFYMFDFRNSGESGGDQTTVGEYEQLDLLAAIRYVKEHRSDKIVLLGYSMGAATSLLAATQSPDVAAVIPILLVQMRVRLNRKRQLNKFTRVPFYLLMGRVIAPYRIKIV